MTEIIFLNSLSDFKVIPRNILKTKSAKIFSFDLDVHIKLQSENIEHERADDLLGLDERLKLFDEMSKYTKWFSKIPSREYEFEGVNLLKISDSHEFQSYMMPNILLTVIIKKIIEQEKPQKIIATSHLSKIIESIIQGKNIETNIFENEIEKKLLWDNITIKYNFGKIPLTLNLSRNKYLKIKKFFEIITGFFNNFWYDVKSKKKGIIFLEFNPQSFSKLFQEMKNYDGNIILVNQRRPAIWNKNSLDLIKKSNCKILNLDTILNKEEKDEIYILVEKFSKKFEKLWANSHVLNEIFQIDGISFWSVIKEVFAQTFNERLSSHISLIYSAKHVLQKSNIHCIVSLNESGETEKVFLEYNKKRIPSILLEHGFIERIEKTKRFDSLSEYTSFKDKISVWGDKKKNWLINEYDIEPERILVSGSPRHDNYFLSQPTKNNKNEKILLLAPNPINDVNGLGNTELKLQFNKTIKQIFSIIKEFNNVKIIVKLHPIQLKHNEEIKELIKKIDISTPIYLWTSVIEIINSADMVLVISPEIHGTSTMLLESMILKKPTMNVYFDKQIPEYDHVKNNAIFTVLNSTDLENNLKKFLFEEKFQNELKINANKFVNDFLDYPGTASKKFASILKSY